MIRKYYIHKVQDHDKTHEVSINSYVFEHFLESNYALNFKLFGSSRVYSVCINDVTDKRFGGDFKKLCRALNYNIGDLLKIEKNGFSDYTLSIIKPSCHEYSIYYNHFGYGRHMLVTEYESSITINYVG